jgi:hypothetical protein
MRLRNFGFLLLTLIFAFNLQAQEEQQPKRFDYGKMWTFENPPTEWFKEAYDFDPGQEWFDDVRKSALRFATWCSASFVSPDGLIMTNHHCSRSEVAALQKDGESFDTDGFVAMSYEDERKAEGLFVEQLLMVEDITARVQAASAEETDAARIGELRGAELQKIQEEYGQKEGWEGLRLQVVTYYSGGKYSLYGYKKYSDIRLVMIPEMQLGYYGGDPDNFTYPRYNLDCTFWRAYDENGKPANTSDHYYKFNPEGAAEGEPVFVVGNPGRTERYRTAAQLAYDRDYRFPIRLEFMENRLDIMKAEYEENPSDELLNNIFGLSNSQKAFTGILGGLQNEDLMARKINMEKSIRAKVDDDSPWTNLEGAYKILEPHSASITLLGPSPVKGDALNLMYTLQDYEAALASDETEEEQLEEMRSKIREQSANLSSEKQIKYFEVLLSEIEKFNHVDNDIAGKLLNGKSPAEAAKSMISESWFASDKIDKLLKLKSKKWMKCDDPLLEASRVVVPAYMEAVTAFRSSTPQRNAYEEQVANAVFQVKGTDLPPDATFTLRIADGVVAGYDYNGTTAPFKTTYYGLYDRYYSNDKEFPWSLPKAWMNPSTELLQAPLNFVSTNDIIGGNSGSAIINAKKEAVGLIFDGNIESLPGNFIFDDEVNRSVSVHAGGIIAALKHVYNADRLVEELLGK